MPSGKFYAVVERRSVDTGGTGLECEKATSPKVRF
jgi:hypothetical protein